jgi:hypothetical protein
MDLGMGYFYFLKSRMGLNTVRLVTPDEIRGLNLNSNPTKPNPERV